jgi:hypothetical protein
MPSGVKRPTKVDLSDLAARFSQSHGRQRSSTVGVRPPVLRLLDQLGPSQLSPTGRNSPLPRPSRRDRAEQRHAFGASKVLPRFAPATLAPTARPFTPPHLGRTGRCAGCRERQSLRVHMGGT